MYRAGFVTWDNSGSIRGQSDSISPVILGAGSGWPGPPPARAVFSRSRAGPLQPVWVVVVVPAVDPPAAAVDGGVKVGSGTGCWFCTPPGTGGCPGR